MTDKAKLLALAEEVPDKNSIYPIIRNSPSFTWPEREAVAEADVEAALGAYVPGGSHVLAWLPMAGGHCIHETARVVMRAAIAAVDKRRSLTYVKPCEACGGNGYSGGKVPSEDMQGEYDAACEVCYGDGKQRAQAEALA